MKSLVWFGFTVLIRVSRVSLRVLSMVGWCGCSFGFFLSSSIREFGFGERVFLFFVSSMVVVVLEGALVGSGFLCLFVNVRYCYGGIFRGSCML